MSATSKRRRVCFLTLVLSHYRVRFHELVRDQLASEGITYDVVYSDPSGDYKAKKDTVDIDWGHKVRTYSFRLLGQELHWQQALTAACDADLTIVGQENKLLINYPLQLQYWLKGNPRFAFFGHGKGHGVTRPAREAWRKVFATRAHWWFAYTPAVKDLLKGYGFPADRITVTNNTIDGGALAMDIATIDSDEIAAFRQAHSLGNGPIGTFIGALYPKKRIGFLIDTAIQVRRQVPDFQLVIVGAGPDEERAQQAAAKYDFIHHLQPCFGREKALLLKASRALLIPGTIGLITIDSFVAGCPIITCEGPDHSPELAYLEDDTNAIILPDSADAANYAAAIVRQMTDDDLAGHLAAGALASSRHYSIENMAEAFSEGVLQALASPSRRVFM